jgi:hypothetical protein
MILTAILCEVSALARGNHLSTRDSSDIYIVNRGWKNKSLTERECKELNVLSLNKGRQNWNIMRKGSQTVKCDKLNKH